MGCDIHSAVEVFDEGKWNWIKDIKFPRDGSIDRFTNEPFDWRYYNMFGFLAGVRGYQIPPLLGERKN